MKEDMNLVRYKHQAIMSKRNINKGMVNHKALAPLFRYAVSKKYDNKVAKYHRDFIMEIMIKYNDIYKTSNVDGINKHLMIQELNKLISKIENNI